MKSLLTLITLCCLPLAIANATPNDDVPEIAVWEAERRGNMVQEIGTTRADAIDLIGAALAPPADDSGKWYLTVVTMRDCPACEKLKHDFLHNKHLQAWVNVEDPSRSTMHYQVRRLEDPTQKDWLHAIEPQLRKGGFPALVIQPPRSGEYGKSATTVAILHGYNGDAEALTDRMRRAIVTYVREYSAQHPEGGIRGEQVIGQSDAAAAPPFLIPSTPLDPTQPNGPVDWPTVINPRPLTPAQIQALVPQAPPEFLLGVLTSQVTEPAQVLQQWQIYQLQNQVTPQQPAEVGPATSWLQVITSLFSGGSFASIVTLAIMLWRKFSGDKELQELLRQLFDQVTNRQS